MKNFQNKIVAAVKTEIVDSAEQFKSSKIGLFCERNSASLQMACLVAIATVSAVGGSHDAFAGTAAAGTTDSFATVWQSIVDFSKGSGGKLLTGLFVVVGVVAGVMKGSLMGFVSGIGCGIGLYNMESIVDGLFGATLDQLPLNVESIKHIANGLSH